MTGSSRIWRTNIAGGEPSILAESLLSLVRELVIPQRHRRSTDAHLSLWISKPNETCPGGAVGPIVPEDEGC